MPSLASLARVTRRGGAVTPPGITLTSNIEDSLETKSWLIYTSMMEAAHRSGESWSTPETDEQGRVITVDSLKRHARSLYPTVDWSDSIASAEFMQPIYRYLRLSGNARIVQRNVGGDPQKAMWSLAPAWGEGSPPTKKKVRTYVPTRTEKKVTPTEAGEDRTPEPVVVVRPTPTPQEEPVSNKRKQRGKVTNSDFTKVDGGFMCPVEGCGDVRPTMMGARGHFGSKHNQRNKFPVGSSNAAKREPRKATEVVASQKMVDKKSPNAALVGHGLPEASEALRTNDPDFPWMCPHPGCGQKFAKFQGIGGHLSKHNAEAVRARLADLEEEVERLRNPDPSTLVDFVVAALTAPKTAPEDKTKMETLQIEVNRLMAKEQDLLRVIADQQGRIDKAAKQIAALLAVE